MKEKIIKELLNRIESDKNIESLYWNNAKFYNLMAILQSNDDFNEEEISILVDKIINLFKNEEEFFYLKIKDRIEEMDLSKEIKTITDLQKLEMFDEMVGALNELTSIIKIHSEATKNTFAWAEVGCAKEILDRAKKIQEADNG